MKRLAISMLLACMLSATAIQGADNVEVGLYLLNLGRLDVATGAFTADFYLSLKCKDNCASDRFEFVNGRAMSVDKIIDKPDEKFYRIQANLNTMVDLKRFPFDKQKLSIIIEDKEKTSDEMIYVPNMQESDIDPNIAFAGWNIKSWEAQESRHEYRVYDEEYSAYSFVVHLSRIPINSFLKTFLPVLFTVLILMFSFIMEPDKIVTRLTISTSSLVATVMFHVSISNQIPPVGYLTLADKFMILTYFVILSSVILNVAILKFSQRKKNEAVDKIHRATEYSVFIAVPAIYVLFFLLALSGVI